METWLTAGFLAVLTAWLVVRHMRASASGAPGPSRSACPRCRAETAPGAMTCSSCGVPLQAYDIVAAPRVSDGAAGDDAIQRAVLRADQCVGCGACIPACPETGALRLENRLAVVDPERCRGHGACVEACPVGALALSSGGGQRLEVPDLDAHFQSSVRGLYIVGEAGGRGLIKNAINEGKIAVEHIAAQLRGRPLPPGAPTGALDIVIVGSGPAGLSAGLEARRRDLRYVVLEQGTLADSIRKYPRHKLLLAEPVKLPLYGDLWVGDASKEELLQVWESVVRSAGLDVRTECRVSGIRPVGRLLQVETGSESLLARTVVLAIGRRGTPRRLGVPGEEQGKVLYDVAEMEVFRNRRVLVVGGGDSAVESALGVCRQAGTEAVLSYRGDSFQRVKERNREKLEAAVAAGRIRLLLGSQVKEIHPDRVVLEAADGPVELPNDDVIVRIGGEPPRRFLARIGVALVSKEISLGGLLLAALVTGLGLLGAAAPARAQVSPGPLAAPHAHLEGNSHCLECHGGGDAGMDDQCLACHEPIAERIRAGRGLHARDGAADCARCHPDHAGKEFELIAWPGGGRDAFDHRDAGWPLDGRHARARCDDCHRAGKRPWTSLDPACAGCHEDIHKGVLGTDCGRCHNSSGWREVPDFDHAAAAFPLLGRHRDVACGKCHMADRLALPVDAEGRSHPLFKPLPHGECGDCHADPHAGRLGADCSRCHVADGFRQVSSQAFDHARTRWPLRGAHREVRCAACHDAEQAWGPRPAFATCGSCHRDAHAGQATLAGRTVDCAGCHDETTFTRSTLAAGIHDATGYPLTGRHGTTACAGCHRRDRAADAAARLGTARVVLRPAFAACRDCHGQDHGRQVADSPDGGDCASCHDTRGFRPSLFTTVRHAATAMPLTGAHAEAACSACHGPRRPGLGEVPASDEVGRARILLVGLPTACAGCHRDPHEGKLSLPPGGPQSCESCHDTDRFRRTLVTAAGHERLGFRLQGAHGVVPCAACHARGASTAGADPAPARSLLRDPPAAGVPAFGQKRSACADCHRNPHGARFAERAGGEDCAACHGQDSFHPATGFDHARHTGFALDGAHERVDCAACHPESRRRDDQGVRLFEKRPAKCADCHARLPTTADGGMQRPKGDEG